MTTTRFPGNPDFHESPPRCAGCGQFCGGFGTANPATWERNDNWDLPDTYTCRCLDCAIDRAMEEYGIDDRDRARDEVLGAIAG